MRHLNRYFLPILAVTVILSASFASPAHAVDMSPNVHPIWTNASPTCTLYMYQEGLTFVNEFYNNQSSFRSIYSASCGVPAGFQNKNTYAVYSFVFDNIPDDNSIDAGVRGIKSRHGSGGDGGWGVIGYSVSSLASNGFKVDIYLYGEKTNTSEGTVIFFNPYNSSEMFYVEPKERVTFVGASYWQVTTDSDFEYDYTSLINSIYSRLGNIQYRGEQIDSKLNTIKDTVNGISQKLDDLKSLQQDANDDANDRYQDEKDTINNNASDAQDTADNADFSFTVGNPLTTWLGLFTGSNCVSIPTIASWIHSNETSVCSPWSSSVRDVTTPIISVLSGTILFGFIVRWLNGSSFNESIEVG